MFIEVNAFSNKRYREKSDIHLYLISFSASLAALEVFKRLVLLRCACVSVYSFRVYNKIVTET